MRLPFLHFGLGVLAAALVFAAPAAAQTPPEPAPAPADNGWQTADSAPMALPPPADVLPEDQVAPPPSRAIGPKRKIKPPAKKTPPYVWRGGKKVLRAPDGPIAWFPGFLRLESGVTRIFLEVNRRVEITEHRSEGRITFRLKGASVPERVNRMPLVAAWIPTAVERVTLTPVGPDADLVIDLKRVSASSYRILDTPRGIVLQVDFPPVAAGAGVPPPPPAVRDRQSDSTQLKSRARY